MVSRSSFARSTRWWSSHWSGLTPVSAGLAPGLPGLLAARTVQGVAAAVMLPASLALVREAYGDPARRARAVSLWAAGGTVAVALGPVAGGAGRALRPSSWNRHRC
ncbi:MFS transporter [Streptomyces sp. NPDC055815]